MKPSIELTIRYGVYGEQHKTLVLPIDESLMEDLTGSVELSDEPFSVLLASPGMYGSKGGAVTIRRKALVMRREIAKEIGRLVADALPELFGMNDKVDGYRKDDLDPDDRALRRVQKS
jgi:hypothetical protein